MGVWRTFVLWSVGGTVVLLFCMFALFAVNVPTAGAAAWGFFALAELWILGSAMVGVVLLFTAVVRSVRRRSGGNFAKPS